MRDRYTLSTHYQHRLNLVESLCYRCAWCALIASISLYSLFSSASSNSASTAPIGSNSDDSSETLLVTHFPGNFFPQILDLALSKTLATHGPYRLIPAKHIYVKQRARQMLKRKKGIRVLWSTTSAKREAELRPIKFSLFKGLNQYRILLIRKGEQQRFDGIQSLIDLRKYTGGSGTYWQDTSIFKANAVPVVTTTEMKGLLKMLAAKRFDYISRGVYEIWGELAKPEFNNFEMEQHLLLKYNADYHFFVHPDDDILAERLRIGLQLAAEDGSFDALFFQSHSHTKAWQEVHHNNRLLIELDK